MASPKSCEASRKSGPWAARGAAREKARARNSQRVAQCVTRIRSLLTPRFYAESVAVVPPKQPRPPPDEGERAVQIMAPERGAL